MPARSLTKTFVCAAAGLLLSSQAVARGDVAVEAGAFKPEYNKVQIPNDSRGDRFRITDLGDSSFSAGRLTLGWWPAENHELQLVYAPFAYSETGVLGADIRFDGASFSRGDLVEARYQFSSYRLRYLYHWREAGRWKFDFGGTLFVRDAGIRLRGAGVESEDSNVGLVPLFAFRSTWRLNDRWNAVLDTDLAIAPQGRAIDLALLGQYRVNKRLTVSGGYRTIEGGADNDDVYNFAWFNGAMIKVAYAWGEKGTAE